MLGNSQIRALYNEVINIFNSSDLPIEVKRLIAEDIHLQIEKQADRAITEELNTPDDALMGDEQEDGSIHLREDSEDAESIFEDKLGELPQ
ncbi:MAG: hypothetical protein IKT30_06885 [Bacteroidaceae bacterium]|nr:hypothetical protein [Bacteroidaceae bacterium]